MSWPGRDGPGRGCEAQATLSVYLEDREPVRLLDGALEALERAVMS